MLCVWCQPDNWAFLEREIQAAVDRVLNTNDWPIYKIQGDNGLEESEYVEFAIIVLRTLAGTELGSIKLDSHESRQLRNIGNSVYGDGRLPYWWGERSMPKLCVKGLVERHPNHPKAWRITDAGRAYLKSQA